MGVGGGHSFNEYLLSPYHVLVSMLGMGNLEMDPAHYHPQKGLQASETNSYSTSWEVLHLRYTHKKDLVPLLSKGLQMWQTSLIDYGTISH